MTDGIRIIPRNKGKYLKRLEAMVGPLNDGLQKDALKGAEEVAAMASSLAPKKTGDYAKSIVAKSIGDEAISLGQFNHAIATRSIKAPSRDKYAVKGVAAAGVFANWFWHIVEYGSVNNPAYPHLTVSYRALRKRIMSRFGRRIGRAARQTRRT